RCSLRESQVIVDRDRVCSIENVLDRIFQIRELEDGSLDAPLKRKIVEAWRDSEISDEMRRLEACLWEEQTADFQNWVRRRYVAAVAQALRTAAINRVPDVSEDDLAVDVVLRDETGDAEIYVSELGPGGLGQLESIVHDLRRSPDDFHAALRNTLC